MTAEYAPQPCVPQFIRGLHNILPQHRHCVATIGSFDGVHLGHRAILDQLLDNASKYQASSVAIIFEPQPAEYFSGEQAPARLMRLREKITALLGAGVSHVLCLPFNRHLCNLTAQQFINQVLVDGLAIRSLVVGDDFCFGKGRQGNFQLLKQAGEKYGFSVYDTQTCEYLDQRISSTRIRKMLEAGNLDVAATLLGRPFQIEGRVIRGQQLGQKIGVPTANVNLHRYRAPLSGVFVVEVARENTEQWLPAVANVGVRPTIGDLVKPVLEVHLLDFNDNLYGERIRVLFRSKVREEQKFSSVDEMLKQIHMDIKDARHFFAQ